MNIKTILLCLLLPASINSIYGMKKKTHRSIYNLKAENVTIKEYPIYFSDGYTIIGNLEKYKQWDLTDNGDYVIKYSFIIYIHPFREENYNFLNRKQMKVECENGGLQDLDAFISNQKKKSKEQA